MKFKIMFFLLASFYLTGCGDTPVFTEMDTNRLKIVIKGTFESESSSNFVTMESQGINTAPFQDDSVTKVPDSSSLTVPAGIDSSVAQDVFPATFMLDIAEIRLNGKKISNYRQVFPIPIDSSHPFFNGSGIELKTDDPGDGNYSSVQLYLRKTVFDSAKVYKLTGNTFSYEKDREVIFHEETVKGFDFNQLTVNSYWDSLRLEAGEIIRGFPVEIPIIGGMKYAWNNGETVLEIRLVIKNFIKKYEYCYYEDGVYKAAHYYAVSDWLRDVKAGEYHIGRNLHTVAKAYVPGKTGSITITNKTGSDLGNAGYIVALPLSEADSNLSYYYITDTGVNLRNAVGISDVPIVPVYPGAYIEPVLDYYLNIEKYRDEWNINAKALITAAGTTEEPFDIYSAAWNTYENAVHGDPTGAYVFGLKIPPYAGYGTSVTFSKMAPGTYKFYCLARPAYGSLFLESDFARTDFTTTGYGYLGEQTIQAGDNLSITY